MWDIDKQIEFFPKEKTKDYYFCYDFIGGRRTNLSNPAKISNLDSLISLADNTYYDFKEEEAVVEIWLGNNKDFLIVGEEKGSFFTSTKGLKAAYESLRLLNYNAPVSIKKLIKVLNTI